MDGTGYTVLFVVSGHAYSQICIYQYQLVVDKVRKGTTSKDLIALPQNHSSRKLNGQLNSIGLNLEKSSIMVRNGYRIILPTVFVENNISQINLSYQGRASNQFFLLLAFYPSQACA